MSQQPELHPLSLQYQVRTSKQGHQEVERLLPLLGELKNAAIRHRRMLGKARVLNKEILRLQNAGITDLRQHDPAFANIARRLAESVVNGSTTPTTEPTAYPAPDFQKRGPLTSSEHWKSLNPASTTSSSGNRV